MKIGYFGGTFDPIHKGHVALARAALECCGIDRILFVPTDVPPHKNSSAITPFIHRYAMVTLALAEAKQARFVPSLLEQPAETKAPRYSLDTICALRKKLKNSDRLFFILGADAFSGIAQWHEPEALLRSCEFIVVSRPGHPLSQVPDALPAPMRRRSVIHRVPRRIKSQSTFSIPGVTIHLVDAVHHPASATAIREAMGSRSRAWRKMVAPAVAEYIQKMHLYEVE